MSDNLSDKMNNLTTNDDKNLDNIDLFEDFDFWTDIKGVKTIAATNDGNSSMKYF